MRWARSSRLQQLQGLRTMTNDPRFVASEGESAAAPRDLESHLEAMRGLGGDLMGIS